MAFPSVVSVTGTTNTSDTTSHSADIGATVNSGDLILIVIATNDNVTMTPATGFTELDDATGGGGNSAGSVHYKIADGTEDSTTVTFTSSAVTQTACTCLVIESWEGTSAGVEISTAATGIDTTPNSASLTPSWGASDTLWITTTCNRRGDRTVTAYPTNYADNQTNTIATGSGGANVGLATRELNASSEDPGDFTLTLGTSTVAWTIGVEPSAGAPAFTPKGIFGAPLNRPLRGPL